MKLRSLVTCFANGILWQCACASTTPSLEQQVAEIREGAELKWSADQAYLQTLDDPIIAEERVAAAIAQTTAEVKGIKASLSEATPPVTLDNYRNLQSSVAELARRSRDNVKLYKALILNKVTQLNKKNPSRSQKPEIGESDPFLEQLDQLIESCKALEATLPEGPLKLLVAHIILMLGNEKKDVLDCRSVLFKRAASSLLDALINFQNELGDTTLDIYLLGEPPIDGSGTPHLKDYNALADWFKERHMRLLSRYSEMLFRQQMPFQIAVGAPAVSFPLSKDILDLLVKELSRIKTSVPEATDTASQKAKDELNLQIDAFENMILTLQTEFSHESSNQNFGPLDYETLEKLFSKRDHRYYYGCPENLDLEEFKSDLKYGLTKVQKAIKEGDEGRLTSKLINLIELTVGTHLECRQYLRDLTLRDTCFETVRPNTMYERSKDYLYFISQLLSRHHEIMTSTKALVLENPLAKDALAFIRNHTEQSIKILEATQVIVSSPPQGLLAPYLDTYKVRPEVKMLALLEKNLVDHSGLSTIELLVLFLTRVVEMLKDRKVKEALSLFKRALSKFRQDCHRFSVPKVSYEDFPHYLPQFMKMARPLNYPTEMVLKTSQKVLAALKSARALFKSLYQLISQMSENELCGRELWLRQVAVRAEAFEKLAEDNEAVTQAYSADTTIPSSAPGAGGGRRTSSGRPKAREKSKTRPPPDPKPTGGPNPTADKVDRSGDGSTLAPPTASNTSKKVTADVIPPAKPATSGHVYMLGADSSPPAATSYTPPSPSPSPSGGGGGGSGRNTNSETRASQENKDSIVEAKPAAAVKGGASTSPGAQKPASASRLKQLWVQYKWPLVIGTACTVLVVGAAALWYFLRP